MLKKNKLLIKSIYKSGTFSSVGWERANNFLMIDGLNRNLG